MYKFVILIALFGVVSSLDLSLGTRDFSRKVFDEDRKASPALWRRSTTVAVVANEGEVISGIFVTDRRPKKDGVVEIIEGGERQRTVALKLKSPAVFRGFDFHVEIYTQPGPQPRDYATLPTVEEETVRALPGSNQQPRDIVEEDFTTTTSSTPAPIDDIVTPINAATEINAIEITEIIPTIAAVVEETVSPTEQTHLPAVDLSA